MILTDGLGEKLLEFEYDDRQPWPERADGAGLTLELIDSENTPTAEYGNHDRWRGSNVLGGTPGTFGVRAPAPGDANMDAVFNQLDIVLVLQSAKYLTGGLATWDEGDCNVDGVFDQEDIVAALQTGDYLQGPYAAKRHSE